MDIPKYWTTFIEAFDKLFPSDFSKSDTFYPDFKCFNDVGKMLSIENTDLKKYDSIPVKTSGKTGTFKLLSPDIGMKEISGEGAWYTNVSMLEYQSLDVKDLAIDVFDAFSSSKVKRFYIDVPALPYYNQTYIHIILDKILRSELGFGDSYVKQLYAGVRLDLGSIVKGVTVMKVSNLGTLHEYLNGIEDPNVLLLKLKTGIPQILEVLMYLKSKRFLFNHNDLKAKNVFVTKIDDKVIWQLADFDKSSISYKGYRFRFHNSKADKYIGYTVLSTPNYKLNNLTYMPGNYKIAQRIMCSPFFYLSYDVYTLIVSILMHPTVIKLMKHNVPGSNDLRIWVQTIVDHLFSDVNDRSSILDILRTDDTSRTVDYSSISNIANLLSSYTLKSDPNFMNYLFSNNELQKINSTTKYDEVYKNARSPVDKNVILSTNTGYMSSFYGKYHICSSPCNGGLCMCNKYTDARSVINKGKC